jgi:hypothetical protein
MAISDAFVAEILKPRAHAIPESAEITQFLQSGDADGTADESLVNGTAGSRSPRAAISTTPAISTPWNSTSATTSSPMSFGKCVEAGLMHALARNVAILPLPTTSATSFQPC